MRAAEAAVRFKKGITKKNFLVDELLQSDVLHQLIIIGEAVKHLSPEFREAHAKVPWKLIAGMRDRLTHGYFDVDLDEVWKTVEADLPSLIGYLEPLLAQSDFAFEEAAPGGPIRWRPCPAGQHWRKAHFQPTYRTGAGKIVRGHQVSEGCCDNPSKKDQIYEEELRLIAKKFSILQGPPTTNNLGFGSYGNKYDELIRGWTRFWNDTLGPRDPLDPNLVKALIATESRFRENPKGSSKAKGLMQILNVSRKSLGGFKNELKDHLAHINQKDILDPVLNIAAGTRWLFQKKLIAENRLKRPATWDEAVAEYKAYLKDMIKDPKYLPEPMRNFRKYYSILNGK